MARFKLKCPIQPDSSDRGLARKTGTGMNREGDKHGRSIDVKSGGEQERGRTRKEQVRHEGGPDT